MFVYFVRFEYKNGATKDTSSTEVNLENKITSIADVQLVTQIIKNRLDNAFDIQVLWYDYLRKE